MTVCAMCAEAIAPDATICPHCGTPCASSAPGPTRTCPACAEPIGASDRQCPHCATVFEQGAAQRVAAGVASVGQAAAGASKSVGQAAASAVVSANRAADQVGAAVSRNVAGVGEAAVGASKSVGQAAVGVAATANRTADQVGAAVSRNVAGVGEAAVGASKSIATAADDVGAALARANKAAWSLVRVSVVLGSVIGVVLLGVVGVVVWVRQHPAPASPTSATLPTTIPVTAPSEPAPAPVVTTAPPPTSAVAPPSDLEPQLPGVTSEDEVALAPQPVSEPAAVPTTEVVETQCTPLATVASRSLSTGRPGEDYPAANAFDGNNDTAWAVRDPISGDDWIQAIFPAGTRITRVWLTTGYEKLNRQGHDLFPLNAHLARFRVETDGGGQTVDVLEAQRDAEVRVDAESGRVRILIEDVFPGQRYQDLTISEIRIYCAQ